MTVEADKPSPARVRALIVLYAAGMGVIISALGLLAYDHNWGLMAPVAGALTAASISFMALLSRVRGGAETCLSPPQSRWLLAMIALGAALLAAGLIAASRLA